MLIQCSNNTKINIPIIYFLFPGVASTTYEYEGDNVGLQQIRAKSSLLAEPLVMHPEQDGSEIICEIVSQENMLRDSKVLSIFCKFSLSYLFSAYLCSIEVCSLKFEVSVVNILLYTHQFSDSYF